MIESWPTPVTQHHLATENRLKSHEELQQSPPLSAQFRRIYDRCCLRFVPHCTLINFRSPTPPEPPIWLQPVVEVFTAMDARSSTVTTRRSSPPPSLDSAQSEVSPDLHVHCRLIFVHR